MFTMWKIQNGLKGVEETVIVEKENILGVKECIRQRKMVSREREKYRQRVSLDLNVYKSSIEENIPPATLVVAIALSHSICCRWNFAGGRLS